MTAYDELQKLVSQLHQAEFEAKETEARYKALETAWKTNKEVAEAEAAKKAAAAHKKELDTQARDLLVQYYAENGKAYPHQHFTIQEDWEAFSIENETAFVVWLIDHAPWLAKQLLQVDMHSPVLQDIIRPQTDGTKAPILDIPVTIKPTVKTTIHWSRLPAPAKTREQIKAEVAADCRALLADHIVILDTETTGIDQVKDEPVSIAVIDKNGTPLINSRMKPIDPSRLLLRSEKGICAADISGIRPEHLANEPTFDQIVEQVNSAFKDKMVLVYNDPFDKHMLQNAASHRAVLLRDFPTTCVMDLFGRFDGTSSPRGGGYKWWKLTDACEMMGIDTEGAHDALADARLTLKLLQVMAAYQPETQPALL